ncbi:MAG: protein kinase [Gemmatimonadaceae bacterium]
MTNDLLAHLQHDLGATYRVVEELGTGGMSRVFLAEEVALARKVVIKVLPPEVVAELSADRFRREMAIMAQLTHPYIVPVLRTSEPASEGLLYYVMPFLDGQSVRALLTQQVQLPVVQARQIAHEVASALDFAHRHGVVHRDIKPENVLLVDGHAMVIDFGVARALSNASADRMTATGLTMGTPNYMSPEQASGERDVDGRSDIYSLGCLLFEMLAGEIPHRAATAQMTLARRLSEPAPDVTKLRHAVPADLQTVLQRALAPVPADRFRTAGDLAAALGSTTTEPAHQATPVRPTARVGWKRIVLPMTTVLALVAAAWLGSRAGGARTRLGTPATAADGPIPIAVLPLENHGRAEDEWFGDGLADELRGALSRHAGLLVKGSPSSNHFRGTTKPLVEVARELGVRYVVTGTVVWEPTAKGRGRVRVSPELIDVTDETTRWQQSFDTSLADLFVGQRALGVRVADALAESLVPADSRRVAFAATQVDPDAYALYLSARRAMDQWADTSVRQAIDLFRRASRADTTFARAYAGLAFAISFDWNSRQQDARITEMFAASDRSARLAPDDPEVLMSRAFVRADRREYRQAREDARRSVALDPGNVYSLWCAADLEAAFGNYEDAVQLAHRASEVDPFLAGDTYAIELMRADRLEEATRVVRAGLALDSMSTTNGWQAHRALLAALRGDLREFEVAQALAARIGRPVSPVLRPIALAHAGRKDEALRQLSRLDRDALSPNKIAAAYAHLGMPDSAMHWMERAVADSRVSLVRGSELLLPLDPDPRYQALLKRVGLR